MPIAPSEAPTDFHERILATAMQRSIGDITLRYTEHQGDRQYPPETTDVDFARLVGQFSVDPKERLAYARESLFAINRDTRLSADQKSRRLDRYLDAYTGLTIRLDHAVFRPDGAVHSGVPDYLPDGLVDMGREQRNLPIQRSREQLLVDKQEILTKYRPLLKEIFQTDYSSMSLEQKKIAMVKRIGANIWNTMTDEAKVARGDFGDIHIGGGVVPLSGLSEGVCRHQSLVFQVLAQAVGVKSMLVKGRLNGDRHAANMVRIEKKWYIVDSANPIYTRLTQSGEPADLRPAIYPVSGPPPAGGKEKVYTVKRGAKDVRYELLGEMYWRIGRIAR